MPTLAHLAQLKDGETLEHKHFLLYVVKLFGGHPELSVQFSVNITFYFNSLNELDVPEHRRPARQAGGDPGHQDVRVGML